MPTLHIIRHGQTDWNAIRRVQGQQQSQLNEKGRLQAERVRESLKDIHFDAVYASPLLRTKQTVEIICKDRTNDIQFHDGLKEMGLGEWETHMWDEIPSQWPEHHERFQKTPHLFNMPGAETTQQLTERGVNAIEHICKTVPTGNVLVVAHNVLIKALILHYAQKPLSQLWGKPLLDNCCRSVLQLDGGAAARWVSIADTALCDVDWEK